ncbi:MAG: hypothetical protein SPI35_04300 [Porphyromonas sp.]|nr:hypothetical protein [Porphyromonas sp.]
MPVINFLHNRLGFNDGIIRKLCESKEIGIKEELYSSVFNRSFETRHPVCSIKQDKSGKFDFKIGRISYVSWFKKKMNEFRGVIGIQKQKYETVNQEIRDGLRCITDFLYFRVRIEITLSKTHTKKRKRYAYLVLENVGNFQLDAIA